MNEQPFYTRLHVYGVVASEDKVFAEQCTDIPFAGFDDTQAAVEAHVRQRLGRRPLAQFDDVMWSVSLAVYGPVDNEHRPVRTGRMHACTTYRDCDRLAFRWSDPADSIYNYNIEDVPNWLCVSGMDFWAAYCGPDQVIGALSESYDPWEHVAEHLGFGAPLAFVNLRTGDLTVQFLKLDATPMGAMPVRTGGPS